MISFQHRSDEVEIMDNLACEGEVVDQTLRELEFINRWLGGNQVTISGINNLLKSVNKQKTISIADLGCGGGDMLKLISHWADQKKYVVSLIGIDANPNIIRFAEGNCAGHSNIAFEAENIFSAGFAAKKIDIITATLFTHHFTSSELGSLLQQWATQSQIGVVINDLHRHSFAFHSIRLLTKFFSRSAMVKFDAPLSVRRGFLRKELEEILTKAGIKNYTLTWRWAFRWQLVIHS